MFLGIPTLSKPAPGAVDFVMDSSSTCSLQTRKQEVIIVSTFKCLFLTKVCCAEGQKYCVYCKLNSENPEKYQPT